MSQKSFRKMSLITDFRLSVWSLGLTHGLESDDPLRECRHKQENSTNFVPYKMWVFIDKNHPFLPVHSVSLQKKNSFPCHLNNTEFFKGSYRV